MEQACLARPARKVQSDLFQKDGLHMTPWVTGTTSLVILKAVKEQFPELAVAVGCDEQIRGGEKQERGRDRKERGGERREYVLLPPPGRR